MEDTREIGLGLYGDKAFLLVKMALQHCMESAPTTRWGGISRNATELVRNDPVVIRKNDGEIAFGKKDKKASGFWGDVKRMKQRFAYDFKDWLKHISYQLSYLAGQPEEKQTGDGRYNSTTKFFLEDLDEDGYAAKLHEPTWQVRGRLRKVKAYGETFKAAQDAGLTVKDGWACYELLQGRDHKKLEKHYGKDVVDGVLGTQKNVFISSTLDCIDAEIEKIEQEKKREIDRVSEDTRSKVNQLWRERDEQHHAIEEEAKKKIAELLEKKAQIAGTAIPAAVAV